VRPMGVEPTTLGFGNQCSTIGAIASNLKTFLSKTPNPFHFLIISVTLQNYENHINSIPPSQKSNLSISRDRTSGFGAYS
jgi:hypothetical protein